MVRLVQTLGRPYAATSLPWLSFPFTFTALRTKDQTTSQHQAHPFGQRKLAASDVTQRLADLRFFYIQTLRKPWSVAESPYREKVQRLPVLLSAEEVKRSPS
jgi:hypothetical protein